MKLPKRFALSTLLLVMLLVSLVFGYAQWRRQWLIAEVDRLKSEGVEMAELSSNWFWPQVEGEAKITFASEGPDSYSFRGRTVALDEVKKQFRDLTSRVHQIGVARISYCMNFTLTESYGMVSFRDFDSLEDRTREIYESEP